MLNLQPATFKEFEREAGRGNVVPVVRSVLSDLHTPVSAFLRVVGRAPHGFLFESVEGGERVARYSFLGADPWMVVRGRGPQTIVERGGAREVLDVPASRYVREHFGDRALARRGSLAPLAGGAVGYLAHEAGRWLDGTPGGNGPGEEGGDD